MKLIIGLGNPGIKYHFTRHNMGFMVVEKLAKANGIKLKSRARFKALTGEGLVGEETCYLAMPETFMNLSGNAIRSIVNWLKIELSDLLLVVDEIALPFGQIRMRPKGSDAGHKGLRSVAECLGTSDFPRMRIGILGRPTIKDYSGYVLSRFNKTEQKALPEILERAGSCCECWAKQGISKAMNKYNSRVQ
ncbi:MAG: aminoacyl-tRNA hydrolase [Candidatus Omnitrophota bacterium]|jgi:PTH1 family peptidyl-tRNA hydrolase|nr:aminoacyl-tRNA hydrolase [Candidatus Omnitrophota bacterium]